LLFPIAPWCRYRYRHHHHYHRRLLHCCWWLRTDSLSAPACRTPLRKQGRSRPLSLTHRPFVALITLLGVQAINIIILSSDTVVWKKKISSAPELIHATETQRLGIDAGFNSIQYNSIPQDVPLKETLSIAVS
jgi:hypothetical protein